MSSLAHFIQNYRDRMTPEICCNSYEAWVKRDQYVVIRRTYQDNPNSLFPDYQYAALKCAKRGNDVYAQRVNKRFDNVLIPLIHHKAEFLCPEGLSNVLFITLSYDTKLHTLDYAWKNVAKDMNKFMASIRRAFGGCVTCRCFEAYEKSAYPHVHIVCMFDEMYFPYSKHIDVPKMKNGRWVTRYSLRIDHQVKEFIASFWHSFVDVEAVERVSKAIHYVGKYITKAVRFGESKDHLLQNCSKRTLQTLAFCWAYRKQAYSFSMKFLRRIPDLIKGMRCSNNAGVVQTDLFGQNSFAIYGKWECLGCFTAVELSINPKEWQIRLSDAQIDIVLEREKAKNY